MSAFFVGTDHVNAILSWVNTFNTHGLPMPTSRYNSSGQNDLTEIGKALLAENIASLRAHYPTDWQEMVDVDVNEYRYHRDFSFSQRADAHVAVIKLCNCLDYQSCEHEGWAESYAKRILDQVINSAIGKLPDYNDAPWQYDKAA